MHFVFRKNILLLFLVTSLQSVFSQPADPLVDSLVKELPRLAEDSNKVKLLMDIGNNISYYDPGKALSYAQQGLALSNKIGYATGQGRTLYLSGNVYLDMGHYEQSWKMLDESETVFAGLKRTDMLGMISNARGNWYYMQSDMWNASHYYGKALEIFQSLKDTAREIQPYQNLIASLGEIKNYEKAILLSKNLLVVLEARKDSLQIAHALNHLVLNYTAMGRVEEARPYIPGLLSYIKETIDYNLASDSYNVIGEYYAAWQQYDTAIVYYKLALEKALRNNYQPAQYNLSIGNAYLQKNELPRAYTYLQEAVRQARQANSRDIYFRACLPLSKYYEKTGDFVSAYRYLQEYSKLNDSVLVAETRQYSTQVDAVYENAKKENQILQLKTEELSKTLAIRERNNYLYIAAVLLVLLAFFFILKSRNDKNRRIVLEQEKKLQQEKIVSLEKEQQVISLQSMITGQETERSRIARDLHDGLGGLFSTVKMYFSGLQHDIPTLDGNQLFRKSYELVDTASIELRRIAHNLMPEVLIKLGLLNAVQDLCNNINIGKLMKISLQAYGMDKRLSVNTEIMLYRIVQELLNNIIKHAQATEVIIQFNQHSDRLTITVEDNGRGFDLNEGSNRTHAGISTIRSRVNYLNGQLNIDSREGVGTTVIMEFLLNEENAELSVKQN